MSLVSEPVTTKRQVLAQVSICNGCCCGRTEKGRPGIPLEYLKREWKSRKLLKQVHLSISGCIGPCDIANVIFITTPDFSVWIGNLTREEEYQSLLDWAQSCANENRVLPLPETLESNRFERWRT